MIYILIGAALIIAGLLVAALCLSVAIAELKRKLTEALRQAQEAERDALAQAAIVLKQREKAIRADAVKRSKAVVTGKVAEHLVPFGEEFDYNPRNVRFLGSPIDFLVFEGLTEGDLARVIFIEVKTGMSRLSVRERQLRDVIDAGEVYWEEIRL